MMHKSFPLLLFPLHGLVDGLDFYLLCRKTASLQSLEALNCKLFHNPSHFQRIIFSLQSRSDNSVHICLNTKLCKTLSSKIFHLQCFFLWLSWCKLMFPEGTCMSKHSIKQFLNAIFTLSYKWHAFWIIWKFEKSHLNY